MIFFLTCPKKYRPKTTIKHSELQNLKKTTIPNIRFWKFNLLTLPMNNVKASVNFR